MKKFNQLLIVALLLVTTYYAQAQSSSGSASYFEGKWNVLLKGIPDGDTKIFIVLQKKDTAMTGVVQDSTGKEISKIDKVELTDSSVTVYFNARGYDVNLVMNKKDEDHITGILMGMFDVEGIRVKEMK